MPVSGILISSGEQTERFSPVWQHLPREIHMLVEIVALLLPGLFFSAVCRSINHSGERTYLDMLADLKDNRRLRP